MSWIRTAMNKAVEAGGNNNLTRTVRTYADSVVLHAGNAVAEGAKLIQDRIGSGHLKSFKYTVKRLEEVSVSCRGIERVQLLRRWLVALKEIERLTASSHDVNPEDHFFTSNDSKESPRKPILVCYVDPGMEGEPKTFRDVFLYSQALEGITLSMILDPPNEEEVSLLSEIYGLCLTGGKEVCAALLSSIQDLAKAFSGYSEEVLVKREELLQYAQEAIAGLKLNPDILRIDVEACGVKEKLKQTETIRQGEDYKRDSKETAITSPEALDEALAQSRLCSTVEELLLQKKHLKYGDSTNLHSEKVHKLKILSESLANSSSQAEKRVLEHRSHKEEALNFRVAKAHEVRLVEKELVVEIGQLERHKDELEAELKKVNSSLASARARLHNAREEREHFDDASNQILVHLKTREDELGRSIMSYRKEANVVNKWISFLESTWVLQSSSTEQQEKQVNGELEMYGNYFVNLVIQLLSSYMETSSQSVSHIKNLADNLKANQGSEESPGVDNDSPKLKKASRKMLEEEYLDFETKLIAIFSIVDTMRKQYYLQKDGIFRKENEEVQDLFDAIKKIKNELDSIERPTLEIECQPQRAETPSKKTSFRSLSLITKRTREHKPETDLIFGLDPSKHSKHELEFDRISGYDSMEDIGEWEFDAFEKD